MSFMNRYKKFALMLCAVIFAFISMPLVNASIHEADVVIYGDTSAAIVAAVQVSRMGKSVIVVAPKVNLGGLSSGGLGWTDTGNKAVIGGLAREFYQQIYNHYQKDESWVWQERSEYGNRGQGTQAIDGDLRTMWIFEPHAAEGVFEDFVEQENLTVHRDEWLDREYGVIVNNGVIQSITTLSGKTYTGKYFIDATYEGDLMAAAGVDFHVGREANHVYNEQWNGVQTGVLHHEHFFKSAVDPYVVEGDPGSGLLPRISAEHPGVYGMGDRKIQAYCFRMCLTQVPENRVPFKKPEGYDSFQYELLARTLQRGQYSGVWRFFTKYDPIPNSKTDTNNHGPFSTDNIGMNYDYPEGSYEVRKQIIEEHRTYQQGMLYFLTTDPRIPENIQTEMRKWGLAKDEFVDNDNWPHHIYVREARRMIGEFVMTEHEVMGYREVPESIGMGSYTLDSHNVQRYVTPEGYVQNEGDVGVKPKQPYEIAYGSILPKKSQSENLLVPVAVSSSHIAFGSIRMEPVFMILGQSAATAAVMAIEKDILPHDIAYEDLKAQLLQDGQVLKMPH